MSQSIRNDKLTTVRRTQNYITAGMGTYVDYVLVQTSSTVLRVQNKYSYFQQTNRMKKPPVPEAKQIIGFFRHMTQF